ncbi:hypothetical protein C5167_007598 [Papaver somniferum]|nr:hypothetical protein C5167_007598 [Papaver somniferum]
MNCILLVLVSICSVDWHEYRLCSQLHFDPETYISARKLQEVPEHNGACNERNVIIFVGVPLVPIGWQKSLYIPINCWGCNCQSPETKCLSLDKIYMNVESSNNQNGLNECSTEGSILFSWKL